MTISEEEGLPFAFKIFYGPDIPPAERSKLLDALAELVYTEPPWDKYDLFVVGDAADAELTEQLLREADK